MSKEVIRKKILDSRIEIPDHGTKSKRVCGRILNWEVFIKSRIILSYSPIKGEVDVSPINNLEKKEIYLPSVEKINGRDKIVPRRHTGKLIRGKFGILQPPKDNQSISLELIELILVPGIAFDKEGKRIGFGFGFYDRFLKKCKNSIKVGVCFELQIVDEIKANPHDVGVDFIITEKRILEIKPIQPFTKGLDA
ncbi:MAG: 5-formyltetrahydrofolate cyclo-ligase [Elusimicrobia bacterium]|nr:5-formyltetrahydrofolate cyclo-ligase [Elusimicrobiota bacterium]